MADTTTLPDGTQKGLATHTSKVVTIKADQPAEPVLEPVAEPPKDAKPAKSTEPDEPEASIELLGWSKTKWFFHHCKAYFVALLVLCLIGFFAYMLVKAYMSGTCRERRKLLSMYVLAEVLIGCAFYKLVWPHLSFRWLYWNSSSRRSGSNFTGKRAIERRLRDLDGEDKERQNELYDPHYQEKIKQMEANKSEVDELKRRAAYEKDIDEKAREKMNKEIDLVTGPGRRYLEPIQDMQQKN